MLTAVQIVTLELAAQIRAKENAVWESAKQRDMHRFADLVADDARMVFVSGVMTKQEYMQEASARTIT
ncbi:MAG: nuclear transport factor 2 family protein, partial [Acidobacteriia bacterium]|nr:nuclear transport factor 2 family protein [Terriglobia bacterium]